MVYERVQKTFGKSSSKKKHTPIVPPLNEEPTQAGSQLSPLVKPYRIPSKEERDAIRKSLFEKWGNATPSSIADVRTHIQAKLTIGEVEDKYEQEADNETLARKANPYRMSGNEKKDDINSQLFGDLTKINETLARTQISPQSTSNSC